jgi:sensor histidine kinase YesM
MKFTIRDFNLGVILSCAIFVVLQFLSFLSGHVIAFNQFLLINFGYTALYTFALLFVNMAVFRMLDRVFEKDRFSRKRLLWGFLSSFVVSLVVIFLLRVFEDVVVEQRPFLTFLAQETASNYIVATLLMFFITLSFYSFYFYKAYQENKVKQQKIIAGTANAKFETLKNQIDPHFLFNSLNVLSSLIEENPENAQRFTTSLSKIYRYVLEQKDKELVSVAEELSFARTYMNLLKMRFENSLFYELPETMGNPEAKVVPLSLQLLLENTVKHNVVSEQRPLHIRIFIEGDYLAIQNDLQKKEVLQDRQGVGLQNIVNRYGIITHRKVMIEETTQSFTVKIPILTKQITVMENPTDYNEDTAYYRAKKRVEELKGFYGNLLSYCTVVPLLVFINLRYTPEFQWFWFSAGGWGFGVAMHAFKVFGYGSRWEDRKIQEIMNREDLDKKWS